MSTNIIERFKDLEKGADMENRKVSSNRSSRRQTSIHTKIPFLKGRPKRETAIDRDDCMNLEIALNTCKTVDELLNYL